MWLRAWASVQSLSHVPLLEHWRNDVMEMLATHEWLKPLTGVGVQGYRIAIPAEAFEQAISQGIKTGLFYVKDAADLPATPFTAPQGDLF